MEAEDTAVHRPTQFHSALVVEDLPDVREWLRHVVMEAFPGIQVRVAADIAGARRALAVEVPQLALIDLGLPDGNGVDLIAEVHQRHPELHCVVTTIYTDDAHLFPALRAGAAGYLLKDLDADELFDLLGGLERGEVVMTRAMSSRLLRQASSADSNPSTEALTEREIDVLRLVADGQSNKRIALSLGLSVHTVKLHLRNASLRLGAHNRTEAAMRYRALRS